MPAAQGFVIAANHIGRLDAAPGLLRAGSPRTLSWWWRKNNEKYAIFRWLVKITNGMFIDRYNAEL